MFDSVRCVIAASLVAVAFTQCSAAAAQFDVRIELTDVWLPLVQVEVNGLGPHRFVIDTAATTTTLDPALASALGLVASGTLPIVTAAGGFVAPTVLVHDVRVGSIRVRDLRVTLISLDELRRDDDRIVGVIGQDVLSRFTLTIDYLKRRARLDAGACDDGDAFLAVGRADGRPMVRAHVSGSGLPSREAHLVIDSAASGLILFGRPGGAPMTARVRTLGGDASARVIAGTTVSVGALELRGAAFIMPTSEPRTEHGLLPASWFSRVCIDGPRARATLVQSRFRVR